jgi:outer membrane immunogenic protein
VEVCRYLSFSSISDSQLIKYVALPGLPYRGAELTNGFGGNGGRDGYTVGGGLEYLFTQNWSGKVEYQYYDLGNVNFFGPVGAAGTFRNDQHTVKVGLNYRFNWGAPMGAPLAPGY